MVTEEIFQKIPEEEDGIKPDMGGGEQSSSSRGTGPKKREKHL